MVNFTSVYNKTLPVWTLWFWGTVKGINLGPKYCYKCPHCQAGLRQIQISDARESRIVERNSRFSFIRYHIARFIDPSIGLLSILPYAVHIWNAISRETVPPQAVVSSSKDHAAISYQTFQSHFMESSHLIHLPNQSIDVVLPVA
jgi:hypothetical protein